MAPQAYRTTSGPGVADHGSHDTSTPKPLSRLLALLEPERQDIITVLAFAVFAGVLYLATPLAVDAVVNNLAFGANEGVYIQALVILSLGLFGFLLLFGFVRGSQYYVTELIQRRIFVRLTADLSYRLPRVRMSALDQKLGPDLVNRFFDVVTVQKSASMLLLDGINLVLAALIGLLILGFYHPFLLVFDLLLILSLVLVLFAFGRGAVRTSIDESYAKHDVAAWLEQVAMYPFLFKTHGASQLASERANRLAERYLEARSRHYGIVLRQISGLLALQAVASALLLGVGGFLVLDAQLTLGQLVAAELIVSATLANLASLGKHAELFYDALAAVDKIGYVVDLPVERSGGETECAEAKPAGAKVEVRSLTYGYDPSRPVLTEVNLNVEPGERVGLVGVAGAGTSTIMDLLTGIRTPTVGAVEIDGRDVRDWQLPALRQRVSLVRGQDIVQGTVLENVALGRPGIGRGDVQNALESLGLLTDIMNLPDGLDTQLMVGGRPLSSSQRSRLILSRAIVDRPRLLLLDQNLENLESRTFADLADFVFDRSSLWTLIVASRDEEVLKRCDRTIDMASFGPIRTGMTG